MDKYLDLYLQSFPKGYILVCILRLKQTGSHVRPSHLPPSAKGHVPAIILSWAFGLGRSWAFGTSSVQYKHKSELQTIQMPIALTFPHMYFGLHCSYRIRIVCLDCFLSA